MCSYTFLIKDNACPSYCHGVWQFDETSFKDGHNMSKIYTKNKVLEEDFF